MLDKDLLSDNISILVRRDVSPRTIVIIVLLAVAVGTMEGLLFEGYTRSAIVGYCVLLLGLSLAPLTSYGETSIFRVFVLISVFRLVNLSMPVFFDQTLLWFPLVYASFIPVCLPWWFRKYRSGKLRAVLRWGYRRLALPKQEMPPAQLALHRLAQVVAIVLCIFVAIALLMAVFLITVYLAEIEYEIAGPSPLISSLDPQQFALLAVVMIGFVGFVEELLFRGIIQQELETHLGPAPGVILTSCIFAAMHSAHASPVELAFAGGIGLLFGLLYDVTGSLSLVSGMHGVLNVFVFGVIPLSGAGSSEVLQALLGGIAGILF